MTGLMLVAVLVLGETELEACQRLAPGMEGETEVRMPDETRCDILTKTTAWEVDWAPKWAEGVGQALLYSIWTGKEPGLLLLVRDRQKEKAYILRAKLVCERAGVRLRVEASP